MSDWLDAERHVARADELGESGQWDAAAQELRQAVEKVPDQGDWQFHLGLALERIEQHAEAAKVFEAVRRLRGEDADVLLHLGINQLWAGEPDAAVATLQAAAKADPERHEPHCFAIAAHAELDDAEGAELAFYRAQQIGDDCPACFEHLGASLARRGELRKAAWCWAKSLKLDKGRRHLHRMIGQAYWQLGEAELAKHHLGCAVADDVTDAEALLTLGVVLVELGETAAATEKLRWAVEVEPKLAVGHLYLGELALLRGDIDGAAMRFERVREIDPLFAGAASGLARVELARGRRESAKELALCELDAADHSAVQRLDLGRLLLEVSLAAEAFEVLDDLVADVESDEVLVKLLPDSLLARGAALALLGSVREGLDDMRRAAALDPTNVVAAQSLGMVYLSVGCPWRALAWLRKAETLERPSPHLTRLRRKAAGELALRRARRLVRKLLGR